MHCSLKRRLGSNNIVKNVETTISKLPGNLVTLSGKSHRYYQRKLFPKMYSGDIQYKTQNGYKELSNMTACNVCLIYTFSCSVWTKLQVQFSTWTFCFMFWFPFLCSNDTYSLTNASKLPAKQLNNYKSNILLSNKNGHEFLSLIRSFLQLKSVFSSVFSLSILTTLTAGPHEQHKVNSVVFW